MATNFYRTGGFSTDTPGQLIYLWGHMDTTSGNVSSLRKNFTTSGYQVTSGKTLYVVKAVIAANNNAVTMSVKLGYCDNDVGLNTTTARTNPVMAFGTDSTTVDGWSMLGSNTTTQDGLTLNDIFIPIAISAKFPFMRATISAAVSVDVHLWCLEQ